MTEDVQEKGERLAREIGCQVRMAPEILGFAPDTVFLTADQVHALSFVYGRVDTVYGLRVVIVTSALPTPRLTRLYDPVEDSRVVVPVSRQIDLE